MFSIQLGCLRTNGTTTWHKHSSPAIILPWTSSWGAVLVSCAFLRSQLKIVESPRRRLVQLPAKSFGQRSTMETTYCRPRRTSGNIKKNLARALRCTEKWQGSEGTVIFNSGFMHVSCAYALMDVRLYSIGNVKPASDGFPKAWLRTQVARRGDRALSRATVILPLALKLVFWHLSTWIRSPWHLGGQVGPTIIARPP